MRFAQLSIGLAERTVHLVGKGQLGYTPHLRGFSAKRTTTALCDYRLTVEAREWGAKQGKA